MLSSKPVGFVMVLIVSESQMIISKAGRIIPNPVRSLAVSTFCLTRSALRIPTNNQRIGKHKLDKRPVIVESIIRPDHIHPSLKRFRRRRPHRSNTEFVFFRFKKTAEVTAGFIAV
jgi:hypothetical protein